MKKIPIILTSLSLAIGTSGITNILLTPVASATDTVQIENTSRDLYFEDLYKMKEYFWLTKLNFAKNELTFNVGHSSSTEWATPQKILIVMRDYESGITEDEANEAVKTLGVGDGSWYKVITDMKEPAGTNYAYPKTMKLEENLPDVLYFAIQYAHKTVGANGRVTLEDEYWVRGKVDYRNCIHSALFDSETMACTVKMDNITQTAQIAAIKDGNYVLFPEDEKVLTWEEELKTVVKERITNLKTQLTHIKTQLPNLGSTLFLTSKATDNMQKSLTGMSESPEINQGLVQLRTLMQQIQYTYDWMIGAEQQKQMDALQVALDAARAEIERLKQESSTSTEEILQAQQQLVEMTQRWQETQEKLDLSEADKQEKYTELLAVQEELAKLRAEMKTLHVKLGDTEAELAKSLNGKTSIEHELSEIKAEMAKILTEKEEIMQKVQVLTNDTTDLEQKNADLKAENIRLQQEKLELETKNTALISQKEELEAKIKSLEAELAQKSACVMVGEVQVGNHSSADTEDDNRDSVAVDDNITSAEAIEVPSLGEIETKTNFWWMAVAIVGALGVLGLCCRKYLKRN